MLLVFIFAQTTQFAYYEMISQLPNYQMVYIMILFMWNLAIPHIWNFAYIFSVDTRQVVCSHQNMQYSISYLLCFAHTSRDAHLRFPWMNTGRLVLFQKLNVVKIVSNIPLNFLSLHQPYDNICGVFFNQQSNSRLLKLTNWYIMLALTNFNLWKYSVYTTRVLLTCVSHNFNLGQLDFLLHQSLKKRSE